jgi:hypothetical protein
MPVNLLLIQSSGAQFPPIATDFKVILERREGYSRPNLRFLFEIADE